MRTMVPPHVWALVSPYGLTPDEGERPKGEAKRAREHT